ncbi:MAG: Twin-arginine translocation pathway signal sequence domain-containing protein [Myxococcales bacterium]|nr:Twin-arginine translocation pathway signal sequence domain-containing protein [Myxococcales bacterium]
MHRRDFLKAAGLASITLLSPAQALGAPRGRLGNRTLVLVELQGGNDGLNTLIPFADPRYYALRPRLAVERDQVLQVSGELGLHPALKPLMSLWEREQVAIVAGVGYPNPNRSHFRSIEIWETASNSDQVLGDGWLARAWGEKQTRNLVADGIVVGDSDAGPLIGEGGRTVLMDEPRQFINQARRVRSASLKTDNPALKHILSVHQDLEQTADRLESYLKGAPALRTRFPNTQLGRKLSVVARLVAADVPAPVMKVALRGFDTHARQHQSHPKLLGQLGDALAAFQKAMVEAGRWNEVLVMTYSEFGRRPAQNASGGTDHGTAAPHFVLGGRVRGGLYGHQPSLSDLQGDDLKHHVDFRQMYATAIRDWWGLKPNAALSPFKSLGYVKG